MEISDLLAEWSAGSSNTRFVSWSEFVIVANTKRLILGAA